MKIVHLYAPRLLAGFGTLALAAALGLFASRPAHTVGGPVAVAVSNTVQSQDIDNPTRQPFQQEFYLSVSGSGSFNSSTLSVPAGKRLVIEYVEAFSTVSIHPDVAYIQTTVGGQNAYYHFSDFKSAGGYSEATGLVRLYADPGTTVTAFVGQQTPGAGGTISVTLSGYLVNVP